MQLAFLVEVLEASRGPVLPPLHAAATCRLRRGGAPPRRVARREGPTRPPRRPGIRWPVRAEGGCVFARCLFSSSEGLRSTPSGKLFYISNIYRLSVF